MKKLYLTTLLISIFCTFKSYAELCESGGVELPVFTEANTAEFFATDCMKENARRGTRETACACIDKIKDIVGPNENYIPSPQFPERLNKKRKAPVKSALFHISNLVNNLDSGLTKNLGEERFTMNCNLEEFKKIRCPNSNSLFNDDDISALVTELQNTMMNNDKTSDFSLPDLVSDRNPSGCLIPDKAIYKVNHQVSLQRVTVLMTILEANNQLSASPNVSTPLEFLEHSALSNTQISGFQLAIQDLKQSLARDPILQRLLNDPSALQIFTTQDHENFGRRLNAIMASNYEREAIEEVGRVCKEIRAKLPDLFCQSKNSVPENFQQFKDLTLAVSENITTNQNNSNLLLYCSENETIQNANELVPPEFSLDTIDSFENAFKASYDKQINFSKIGTFTGTDGRVVQSLSMCDYIPQPGKAYNEKGVEEAINENCGKVEGSDEERTPFTYKCLQAKAVKALYGEKLEEIGNLEEKIRLAGPSPSPTQTIEVGGEEILVSKAIKLREQLAKNLFKEDMEKPSIVEEFITGKKSKRRDLQLAASTKDSTKSNSGEGNTSISPAVAKTSATSTAATYTGAQASAQPTENNSDYQREFAAQTQRDRNTQELFNEVQRRIREGNQRSNRELASISDQVRDIRSGVNSRSSSPISPFMRDVLDQSTRHIPDGFYDGATSDFEEEDYYPETDANGAPIFTDRPVNDGSPARERTQEEERERALEEMYAARAAAGRSGGRSRGPASVGGSSSGAGSAPFAIQGGGISNLGEVEPTVLELKDDLDPNNLNIIDLANSSPESAERLLNLIEDNSVSSFVIKKGKLQVTVFRRGNRFVVRSDGANELAPGFRAFKQSIERSIAQDSVNALLAQLRSGIENSNSSQYQNFTNSF